MIKKKFFLVYICLIVVLVISSCSSTTIPKEVVSTTISSTEDSTTATISTTTSTDIPITESTETVTSTTSITSVPTTTSIPPTIVPKTNLEAIRSLPNSGMMCLTFDDGFSNIETILNCLRQNNVHCTFFIIGRCLKTYPDLWKQAVADGNEICYHSMTHGPITSLTDEQILADVTAWNELAHKILGDNYIIPKIARLPGGGGNTNQRVLSVFNSIGYSVISWNSDTFYDVLKKDPKASPQKIADYVIKMASVGTISLQHFNKSDAPSVSLYIETLKQKYTLGKISDALIASSSN